ncbi:MAG: calcium-binding protein [Pseudomonadota bacterium]
MALTGTSADDQLTGGDSNDLMNGFAGDDLIQGGNGNDTLFGGDGDDTLQGGSGADSLSGGNGDDRLYGGKGADTMDGGANGAAGDWADYAGAVDNVLVDLASGIGVDDFGATDTLLNLENAYGGVHDDTLIGNDSDNVLNPGGGDDVVSGGEGFDTVSYEGATSGVNVNLRTAVATGAGTDQLFSIEAAIGSSFNDTLTATDVSTPLYGRGGDDILTGGAGNDTLVGGSGADTISGGAGVDVLSYAEGNTGSGGPSLTGKGVTVNLATGTATDNWGNTDTFSGIEVVWGSNKADVLTGGNTLNGLAATEGFEGFLGGAGNDTINGGIGFDVAMYTTSTSAVTVTLGGTAAGSAKDGLLGTDVLTNIEGVQGSDFNDILKGSDTGVFESFEGRAGNDSIDGLGGVDRASYATSPAAVIVNLTTGVASDGWGGSDTLAHIESVLGSTHNDSLTGGTGNDTLEGGLGNDTLDGGAGNDLAVFSAARLGYEIQVDTTTGTVTVSGPDGIDTLRNIEALQFSDATFTLEIGSQGADTLTGTDGGDAMFGGGGNDGLDGGGGDDELDGGDGADTMVGGAGNDTYFVDNTGDEVIETDGAVARPNGALGVKAQDIGSSIDKVVASISFTLGSFVENLQLAGGSAGLSGVGNGLDNVLAGNSGSNMMRGLGGNDAIDGGDGIDTAGFAGERSQYAMAKSATGFQVDGTAAGEGTDSVTNIERLEFTDGKVALDLSGDAGEVARILGAVFGREFVSNQAFVGIGLTFADSGMSYQSLVQLALDARLGAGASNAAVVDLLFTNVVGAHPDAAAQANFVGLLENHTFTQAGLGILAADFGVNLANINFVGLEQSGLAYV